MVVVAGIVAFVVMEAVSYSAHRWLMHGAGMAWHRSHHAPAAGRFERNDLFPLCFSAVGVTLFAVGAWAPGLGWCTWVGLGVTAYGFVYLFVHEVHIHRRLPVPLPRLRYLDWLRESHRAHHRTGGEPYGMLLPLVRSSSTVPAPESDVLDRAIPSTRSARARL